MEDEKQVEGPSLIRFIGGFVVALLIAIYLLVGGRWIGGMGFLLGALFCGGYFVWQARRYEDMKSLKKTVLGGWRNVLD